MPITFEHTILVFAGLLFVSILFGKVGYKLVGPCCYS